MDPRDASASKKDVSGKIQWRIQWTLSLAGVRSQSKLLLSRLEVIGPVAGANAAAGRQSYALNLEKRMANQRRADQLSRIQGKALLRRGQFKID